MRQELSKNEVVLDSDGIIVIKCEDIVFGTEYYLFSNATHGVLAFHSLESAIRHAKEAKRAHANMEFEEDRL